MERAMTSNRTRGRSSLLTSLVATALFVWGVVMLTNGLVYGLAEECATRYLMASIGLLPSSCVLYLTSAYLWVHRDK
jgi:hypothetical protein